MAKASDSKGKTLAAAARLFRQQGYHGTALHDILAAGGSPRGSLYFHFPGGKEEIGETALTLAGEAVRQAIAHAAETSETAELFLTRIARGMASDLEKSDIREGCPIATTALETSAQSDMLGAATRGAFKSWENEIKRGLEHFGMGVGTSRSGRDGGAQPARRRAVAGTHLSQPRADAARRAGTETSRHTLEIEIKACRRSIRNPDDNVSPTFALETVSPAFLFFQRRGIAQDPSYLLRLLVLKRAYLFPLNECHDRTNLGRTDRRISENRQRGFSRYQSLLIALLAFVQFTVILDFMIMSPLGAIIMPALNITAGQFGVAVSAYAFSAGISGILAAGFADRFDRKRLLLFFYLGFTAGTALCALAPNYHVLLIGRIVTGLFGGVIGSIVLAIITDLFALNLRGRVMGFVQTAFAASQVLGIPVGLFLSNHWNWHVAFGALVGLSIAAIAAISLVMRPVNAHLCSSRTATPSGI